MSPPLAFCSLMFTAGVCSKHKLSQCHTTKKGEGEAGAHPWRAPILIGVTKGPTLAALHCKRGTSEPVQAVWPALGSDVRTEGHLGREAQRQEPGGCLWGM